MKLTTADGLKNNETERFAHETEIVVPREKLKEKTFLIFLVKCVIKWR